MLYARARRSTLSNPAEPFGLRKIYEERRSPPSTFHPTRRASSNGMSSPTWTPARIRKQPATECRPRAARCLSTSLEDDRALVRAIGRAACCAEFVDVRSAAPRADHVGVEAIIGRGRDLHPIPENVHVRDAAPAR